MNDGNPKLLILGAASVTGRSFARALRMSRRYVSAFLIGGDIFDNIFTATEGLYDVHVRMPRCDRPNHRDVLKDVAARYNVSACVVMAELEVMALASAEIGPAHLLPSERFCRVAESKAHVLRVLAPKGFGPKHVFNGFSVDDFEEKFAAAGLDFPIWLRSSKPGSTSGAGSLLATDHRQVVNWLQGSDPTVAQAAEYLPGRNWACLMTYRNGRLTGFGIYERISYLMARAAPSGVTGNIAVGQIKWNADVLRVSLEAIRAVEEQAASPADGFLTVDLKERGDGLPVVTEINLKPVACVGAFCHPGANLAEHFVSLVMGAAEERPLETLVSEYRDAYATEPFILRDVDGPWTLVNGIERPDEGGELQLQAPPWLPEDRRSSRPTL